VETHKISSQIENKNTQLQHVIDIQKYYNDLKGKDNSYLKNYIQELITQIKELKD
jgi:hypothetical protein